MKQWEQVVAAMKLNGGYATLNQLYHIVDTSSWITKTPEATIRRIVQQGPFIKVKPGLWALSKLKEEVLLKLSLDPSDKKSDDIFTHSYYQGLVVQIGNSKKQIKTYIPPQDKNRMFLETKLSNLATCNKLPIFTNKTIQNKARTVDVIYFNERNMPCGFYEIEHSTNITNSLNKFYELQDFRADFRIVADSKREKEFKDKISMSIYDSIREYVSFISYDDIVKQYEKIQITLNNYI